ncbi:DUF211 domain-containing protein [Actinocatenispora comari]|jgi:hypothetical protein|uniref:DUF211 domain-containing protein n=1 Tax=Actinocatenispora comari TaxID=2807577 RepID=A0A8J4EIX8_9ACTN|nr:DUF211 domain-containing protein [Actinocatenispora comari]GIL25435.1 hypothetical protein NUM_06900 [Actinocatenispora comari]
MPIRRLGLDVDKVLDRPGQVELAQAIERCAGVEAVNVTVTDIDIETVGMDVTVVGDDIDANAVYRAIEQTGAVVHSIDEVVAGSYLVDRILRAR